MAVFLKAEEIKSSLNLVVKDYMQECVAKEELPRELVELLKHNFLAKYVCYNKQEKTIEVGINESHVRSSTYPIIKIYSFPVDQTGEWVSGSFKSGKADLEFYGKLLTSNDHLDPSEVVLL